MNSENINKIAADLFSKQSGLGAVVGGFLGAVISAVLWKVVSELSSDRSAIFMLASGLIVGLMVLFCGGGLSLRFRLISLVFTLASIFCSLSVMQLSVRDPFTWIWLVAGLGISFAVSEKRLDIDQRKAVWQAIHKEGYSDNSKKNSIPILILSTVALVAICFVATLSISIFYQSEKAGPSLSEAKIIAQSLDKGRSIGHYFSEKDCKDYARDNRRNCSGPTCDLENNYILKGCLEIASPE